MDTLKFKTKEKIKLISRLMTAAMFDLLYDDPYKAYKQIKECEKHMKKVNEWMEKLLKDSQ